MNEPNMLFDAPSDVTAPEPEIDQRLVAAWLASLRPDEVPWWIGIEDIIAEEYEREDAFHQALKLTISSTR